MTDDALDFLIGATGPAAKFPNVGYIHAGKVLAYEKRQSKDIDGVLKFWDDGTPVYEAVITIQTEERDASLDDDDGVRRLFVRGGMLTAVRDALKKAGKPKAIVGGELKIRRIDDGAQARRGYSAPHRFQAKFEPPSPSDDFDDMAGTEPEYADDEAPF